MGYFSNGSEGMDYEERWCNRCRHQTGIDGHGCPVWLAHMLYNYEECNKPNSILHLLIPRTENGWKNGQCLMFVEESK